jgi:hypothetical protein
MACKGICCKEESVLNPEYKIPFGEYKGKTMEEVPISYVIRLMGYILDGPNKSPNFKNPTFVYVRSKYPMAICHAEYYMDGLCWSCRLPLEPSLDLGWSIRVLHNTCRAKLLRF